MLLINGQLADHGLTDNFHGFASPGYHNETDAKTLQQIELVLKGTASHILWLKDTDVHGIGELLAKRSLLHSLAMEPVAVPETRQNGEK